MTNIFVNHQAVGTLRREEPRIRFDYADGAPAERAVSLLMPPLGEPYFAEENGLLHPIFDMSLPEGALRAALQGLFSKAMPAFDDLALFQIVGRSLIGRIRAGRSAFDLDQVPAQNLKDLLGQRGTGELFGELLRRYAEYSGIAGVQPKVLVRDDGSLQSANFSPIATGDRISAPGSTHIVKAFDRARYPGLAVNEWLCLRAARAAGLKTARAEIARDGQILVIERFDRRSDGAYSAFEDGCALDGKPAREKYLGSYEQLASVLGDALRGPEAGGLGLAQFFRSLVVSVAVRNGDAHRKNFGAVYDAAGGDVSLAPAFDVITTTVYVPGDSLALTLDGTKRWPDARGLEKFAVHRCGISPSQARAIVAEVRQGVAETLPELKRAEAHDPGAADIARRMAAAWTEGLASLAETPAAIRSSPAGS